jgi:uncharacterized protein YukE
VGNDMASLASSAETRVRHSLDASIQTAMAHSGWASSGVLQACQQEWSKHLTMVVGEISAIAQKLHDSARTIEQADEEAARRLRKILDELSR